MYLYNLCIIIKGDLSDWLTHLGARAVQQCLSACRRDRPYSCSVQEAGSLRIRGTNAAQSQGEGLGAP
jgi:hypothetical protein